MGSHTGESCAGFGLLHERGEYRIPVKLCSVRRVVANSGSMSQSDPREVDWKQSFYGVNYQTLYSIKAKYDPDHVFYGNTSVGSDDWSVQGNGALCWTGDN